MLPWPAVPRASAAHPTQGENAMQVLESMATSRHEQVLFCRHESVGLRAIIAIHDTTLGPALGGCRLYPYTTEGDALEDVLRLARHMTYKAAMAGLDLGGGHSVILGERGIKSKALFRTFGRHVESLGGRYICAEDMNTTVADMSAIRRETRWVVGVGHHEGGTGDPAPFCALGVFHGIRACLEVVYGSPDPAGRTVAIQGVGNVGYHLARFLHQAGAELMYCDFDSRRLERVLAEFGGVVLEGDDFWSADCDVLSPCAIGGVVNQYSIPLINAPIVAGGANRVLDDEARDGAALVERGITYAPDYVVNSGGLISVHSELTGWGRGKVEDDTAGIFVTTKRVLNKASAEGTTTIEASNRLAEQRIEQVALLRRLHIG